jgi:DNA end-binding protein Ku
VETNGNEQDEGGTLKKKVATGVAVGLATTAAAGVAKKLMDTQDDETEQQDSGGSQARGGRQTQSRRGRSTTGTRSRSGSTRSSGATKRSSSGARRATKSQTKRSSSSTRSSGTRGTKRTKEQLYNQAKRLGIEGRSTMTKAQLERAIQRARS